MILAKMIFVGGSSATLPALNDVFHHSISAFFFSRTGLWEGSPEEWCRMAPGKGCKVLTPKPY